MGAARILGKGKNAAGVGKSIMRAVAQRKRMEQLKQAKELAKDAFRAEATKKQMDIANPDPQTINIPIESEAGALYPHHMPDAAFRLRARRGRYIPTTCLTLQIRPCLAGSWRTSTSKR